jgi:hypothetical protein
MYLLAMIVVYLVLLFVSLLYSNKDKDELFIFGCHKFVPRWNYVQITMVPTPSVLI